MNALDGKKTYTGIAAMLLAWLGEQLGVDLGDGTEIITALVTLLGAALAIYGRLVAKPKPDSTGGAEGLKSVAIVTLAVLLGVLGGCVPHMPRAPATVLEEIEAAEISTQELSESIVNLTCTRFEKGRCIEPGKSFSPSQGRRYHDEVQEVRKALRVAASLSGGEVRLCLGEARDQIACLKAAQALLAQIEVKVLEREGGRP